MEDVAFAEHAVARIVHDAAPLPFPDGSQDEIRCPHVLEHVADYRAALAGWHRLLRDGGKLAITVRDDLAAGNPGDGRAYSPGLLLAEVEEALDPLSYRVASLEQRRDPDRIELVVERLSGPAPTSAAGNQPSLGWFPAELPPADREPVLAIESERGESQGGGRQPGGEARVAVLKLDHRGDFIMARRGFELLRGAMPDAHMTLVCGSWNCGEAERLSLFDRIVPFDFFPEAPSVATRMLGLDEASSRLGALLAGQTFALAIDMRVHDDTRGLLAAIDAAHRAGFGEARRFPFLDIALPFSSPTVEHRAYRAMLSAQRFKACVGRHEGYAIVVPSGSLHDAPGALLVHGPYEDFEPGAWDIEVIAEPLAAEFDLAFDLCATGVADSLGEGILRLRHGMHPRFQLVLAEPAQRVELRLRVGSLCDVRPFRFLGIRVTRPGSFAGLHQEEMQGLLATLVGMRMRSPYRVRELAA